MRNFVIAVLCASVATILALSSHIYLTDWTKPIVDQMIATIPAIESNNYPPIIVYSAYATAFINTSILVFLYYQGQHLIYHRYKFVQYIFVTTILFGIKGNDLVRQPLMNLILNYNIMENPLRFVILSTLDKWIANILLAICLVYLCPVNRTSNAGVTDDSQSKNLMPGLVNGIKP